MENYYYFFLLFLTIINFILFKFNNHIANFFNIYDEPDGGRKIHDKAVPLTGGIFLFINIFFIYTYLFTTGIYQIDNFNTTLFKNFSSLFLFLAVAFIIFFFGLIDDKFLISPNKKILLIIILLSILIYFDNSLLLKVINISYVQKFDIGVFSYFWTILCFLLLINAINMFDGFNLQSGMYFLFFLFFLISKGFVNHLILGLVIFLIFFLYNNYHNKLFFGDGGTYLFAFILGYISIKLYNTEIITYADEVVLVMIIPGLDLIRLFFFRLLKKKHPFSPDREHLHHYLIESLQEKKALILIHSFIFVPIILSNFLGFYLEIIIFQIFCYILLVYIFKPKHKSNYNN